MCLRLSWNRRDKSVAPWANEFDMNDGNANSSMRPWELHPRQESAVLGAPMEEGSLALDTKNAIERKNPCQWHTTWERKPCNVRKVRWVSSVLPCYTIVWIRLTFIVRFSVVGEYGARPRHVLVRLLPSHDGPSHIDLPLRDVVSSIVPWDWVFATPRSNHGPADVNASHLRPRMARGRTPWHVHLPPLQLCCHDHEAWRSVPRN